MSDDVLLSRDGAVATLTLNRPQALNALSHAMGRGLRANLARLERDASIRCVVIQGAGDHFMAGGDVKNFADSLALAPEERRRQFEDYIHELHPTMVIMRRMRKPVIASVRGAAAGFGLSLSMACDLTIAAESSYFTLAYVNIGTSPDGSGSYFLPRLVGIKKAMEIALLGDRFDAQTAKDLGIVNFVVPDADLSAATDQLARRLAAGPTHAIGNTKRLLNASLGNSLETQLQLEAESFADCTTTRDMAEGIMAFVEKRKPNFKGE